MEWFAEKLDVTTLVSLKKMTTHKLKQWNSFALKCNDEDKQTNVGGIK